MKPKPPVFGAPLLRIIGTRQLWGLLVTRMIATPVWWFYVFSWMNSDRPLSRNLAYAVSKAGVVNLTQWLAVYLTAGIRVNAVAPGFFANERNRKILMTDDGGLTARART